MEGGRKLWRGARGGRKGENEEGVIGGREGGSEKGGKGGRNKQERNGWIERGKQRDACAT